jgi:hypothetical protein
MFAILFGSVMGFIFLTISYMLLDDHYRWQDGAKLTWSQIGARKLAHSNPHLRPLLAEARLLP